MLAKLRAIAAHILFVLFLLLPFHTFLSTALESFFGQFSNSSFEFIAAWKEICIFIFLLMVGVLIVAKKIPFPRFDALDIFVVLYLLWALFTGFYRWGTDFERILWGAKYSLFFLIFFLGVRYFPLAEKMKSKIFMIMLGAASIVIFFGVLQKFLPENFLVHFGYSAHFSEFVPGAPTAYCQKISFTDVCRTQSFLSGPNQFGAYLLLVLPLFLFELFRAFPKKRAAQKHASRRAFAATFLLLGLAALFFAYSRAAWGGMIVIFLSAFGLMFYQRSWWKKLLVSGIGLGLALIGLLLVTVPRPYAETCAPYTEFQSAAQLDHDGVITEFFCRIVYRPSSLQGHLERSRDGVKHILMHPFGTGLGDSGPASARFYENGIGFIPESWYLQVGIDTGFPGLILFITILILTSRKLLQTKTWQGQALCCGLIGISITALKLHSWESADLAYSFWGACGIVLAKNNEQWNWRDWFKKLRMTKRT